MSGQRKALIVANDEYEQEALQNLLAPAADAEALGRVLGDRQIGDFTVQVVRNEPAHVIQAHIEELFSESRSDDVLLLHFSGHGLKNESGELFFAAPNTRPNRLGSTAVSADFVQRCMRASRSRSVVLLLDCCYGGAFAQGVTVRAAGDVHVLDSFPQERTGGGRGRAVITASNAMEYAFEGDQLADDRRRRPSVFTSALVEGLATGDADRDEDGWISLNELYDYVFDKVREQNPHQTPSRHVELEGELYLARSPRRRIRPAPLPPDLQAAITDPNMYTRLGAVSELKPRLTSDNLPAAVGAYEALAKLARNDIRTVADPAAAALSQAALHAEATELHFGEIEQGSAPPRRTVRLLGPPIARACAPRTSHNWIRVNETSEGFDISVDTTNAGILSGTLYLKGPTGEVAIAVDAELLPSAGHTPIPPREQPPGDQLAAAGVAGPPGERSAAQAHQEAERAAAEQRQQIEQLQQQLRAHGAAQDWDAVLTVNEQLAALDPAAADPDGLASTARDQITRRQDAERAAAERRQQIEQLQQQLRERAAAKDWYAVLGVNHQLAALDPAAADPDGLASTARDQITRRQGADQPKVGTHDRAGAAPPAPKTPGTSAARKRRRWLAVTILTLAAALAVTIIITTFHGRMVAFNALKVGDCPQGYDFTSDNPLPDQFHIVPCSGQHDGEVFFAGANWPTAGAFPGQKVIDNQAASECEKAFSSYVGKSVRDSKLTYAYWDPSADGWSSGNRRLLCVAYDPAGPLNRTVQAPMVPFNAVRAGDCIEGYNFAGNNPTPDQFRKVSCSVEHSGEVFLAKDYRSGTGAYPGDNAVSYQATSECDKAFSSYVGSTIDNSKLSYENFYPRARTWIIGDRRLLCVAYDPNGPLNKTVRGTHQ